MIGDLLEPSHVLFVLLVALLVLGPKRLPELGRSLGRSLREFRSGISGLTDPGEGSADSQPRDGQPQPAPARIPPRRRR